MTTVLDIGSGIRPQKMYVDCVTICVEPCYEYVEKLLQMEDLIVLNTDWSQVPFLFAPKSVDYITLHDVVEHLPKDTGKYLLKNTVPIARKGVSVFTPVGYVEQSPGKDGLDRWGMHGGEWQRHLSGWFMDDFPAWEVSILSGYEVPMLYAYWRVNE